MTAGSIWAPLRAPDYRRLWLGQTISVVGDKVNQIAMGVMVYKLTGSLLQMGVMLGVTMLPAALFGVFAGAYVDRWHRGRTMFVSDMLRAGLVLLVPLTVRLGVGYAYAIAFMVATVSLFFEPAKLSLIPELVNSEHLMAANSLDSASMAGAELFGLALGGALVARLSFGGAFALDAATYVVSACFVATVARRAGKAPVRLSDERGLLGDVREGLAFIWRAPVLRDLVGVYSFAVVGGAASITLSYLLALRTYAQAGPVESVRLAMIDTAITVGLLFGSVLVARSGAGNAGGKFLSGLVLFGVAFASLAFVPSLWVAIPIMLVAGVANMRFQIPMATLLQQQTHESLRGRVFAARATVVRVFTVVGLVGAGVAAERFGIPVVVGAVGMLVALAGLAGWASPALRSA
ncbi:MAG TPA: MFS transporter [Coriobacteriia bacterium]|jgi:MFS family permease